MKSFFKHPKVLLGIIFVITLFFALQLPKMELSNDVLTFIPKKNPEVVNYEKVKEQYGSDLVIDVALEATHGTIFTRNFLNLIKDLTDKFSNIPGVHSVESISSTDIISGTPEGMEVQPLLDNFSGTQEDINALKTKLLSWDIYKGLLFSKDFTATQISVTIDADIETSEINTIYFAIKKELKNIDSTDVKWYIAGMPAVTVLINSQMKGDLIFLIPLVILIVIGTLYLSFRRLGGVILPLSTVVISGIWTLGAMAFFGIQLSLMDTVIPVILVAVGSAYGIHIVSHYYDELRDFKGNLTKEKHKEIVFATLKRIGLPVILAGITTLAGFGSLVSSTVIPMKTFGTFTALGVTTSLIVALTFIPAALLSRHNALQTDSNKNKMEIKTEKFMDFLYSSFHKNKIKIIILTLIIAAAGIYGTTRMVKDNILIAYFKKNTEIRQADKFLREKFNGTTTFDIIVKGEEPGSLTNPEILIEMDNLSTYLKAKYPQVTCILSFTDFVKKMNQSMNSFNELEDPEPVNNNQSEAVTEETGTGFTSFFEDTSMVTADTSAPIPTKTESKPGNDRTFTYTDFLEVLNKAVITSNSKNMSASDLITEINKELNYRGAAYYEIPTDPAKYPVNSKNELSSLISQYLLLYSGELDRWTNDNLEPSEAKMFVQLNTPGTILPQKIALDAEKYAASHFPSGYSIQTVGTSKIMYVLTMLITSSQTKSILISLILVFIILTINYRSLFAGFIGIIPIGLTVLINFGVMGILKIRLDMSTAMVSAVSIGIGIDYTIHYLSYYRHERLKTDNLETVAHNTLKGVGKAIIFNAVSVAGGFLVMLLSNFTPLNYFGLLVALTMITSSTASLTLLPILLEIIKPKFIHKEKIS